MTLELMKVIPDKSVDLIVIDPPYNIGKDKRWDKWQTVDAYVAFMSEVFTECERVLKYTGSFYWFHNDMSQIRKLMDSLDDNTSFNFKNLIIWNKRYEGSPRKYYFDNVIKTESSRSYRPLTEYCLFYTLQDETGTNAAAQGAVRDYLRNELKKYGKASDINRLFWKNGWAKNGSNVASHFFGNNDQNCLPTPLTYERLQTTGYFQKDYEELRGEYEALKYTYNHQKTHHDVWDYEVASKLGHVTPKPVEMIENIIRHSSNEGDVVLDCFLGSGTTAIAAINTNRNYIGIEREPEYVSIARQRISDAMKTEVDDNCFECDTPIQQSDGDRYYSAITNQTLCGSCGNEKYEAFGGERVV